MLKLGLILDTNIFLQYQDITAIDWTRELDVSNIALLVCPTLFDELDKHKESGNRRQQNRARHAFRLLDQVLEGDFTSVRDNVAIQLIEEVGSKYLLENNFDPLNPDHQFIGAAQKLSNSQMFKQIKIVSGDRGMKARAKSIGVEVFRPSEKYELPPLEDNVTKQNRHLKNKLEEIENSRPKLNLTLADYKDNQVFSLEKFQSIERHEVEMALKEIKFKYPKKIFEQAKFKNFSLNEDESIQRVKSTLINVADAFGPTNEQWNKFNQDLEKYYLEYEDFVLKKSKYEEVMSRTLCLEIWVENTGSSPATDIDIWSYFPDGFKMFEEDELPKPPEEPRPPTKPMGIAGMEAIINSSRFDNLVYRHPSLPEIDMTPVNVHTPIIRETNSYEVDQRVEKLKHSQNLSLGLFYIQFPSYESADSFDIKYSVHASELIEPSNGILKVIVKK